MKFWITLLIAWCGGCVVVWIWVPLHGDWMIKFFFMAFIVFFVLGCMAWSSYSDRQDEEHTRRIEEIYRRF